MSVIIHPDNSITIDGKYTGLKVEQTENKTYVYTSTREEVKLPYVQYSTTQDYPSGGIPGRIKFNRNIRMIAKIVGRPKIMTDGKRVNVYLDAATLAAAEKLGKGNVSAGIRIALRHATK